MSSEYFRAFNLAFSFLMLFDKSPVAILLKTKKTTTSDFKTKCVCVCVCVCAGGGGGGWGERRVGVGVQYYIHGHKQGKYQNDKTVDYTLKDEKMGRV